jgi:hypothetical protein
MWARVHCTLNASLFVQVGRNYFCGCLCIYTPEPRLAGVDGKYISVTGDLMRCGMDQVWKLKCSPEFHSGQVHRVASNREPKIPLNDLKLRSVVDMLPWWDCMDNGNNIPEENRGTSTYDTHTWVLLSRTKLNS